ncbi:hypothetical protein [Filomicrobium sp.]|uniref:hypothetical protein n=1 Tax=Filomicrobium sp. TaxID=2024831 RepID=UPI00258AF821|nr:hypothetical protein [Filomicrobium sp.]MCV0370429.1 hypothetical protein [Filomicrobium sp.]
MAPLNLTKLQAACTAAHDEYRAARKTLASAIGKDERSNAMLEMIASTIDIGLNATLHRLKTDDPKIIEAVERLSEASHHLGLAINAREEAQIENNPNHQRVYVDDGREFTLDLKTGTWTYLDAPDKPIKLSFVKSEKLPYELPGFEPKMDPPKPTRSRKRTPRM